MVEYGTNLYEFNISKPGNYTLIYRYSANKQAPFEATVLVTRFHSELVTETSVSTITVQKISTILSTKMEATEIFTEIEETTSPATLATVEKPAVYEVLSFPLYMVIVLALIAAVIVGYVVGKTRKEPPYCIECGTKLRRDAEFCYKCGKKQT